jgi:hypothetical protein
MQNLLVHVACHPRRKHLMYVGGKINLSEREDYNLNPMTGNITPHAWICPSKGGKE